MSEPTPVHTSGEPINLLAALQQSIARAKKTAESTPKCTDCGNVPGGDGCPYSSTCECPTCGTAAYCDGAC